MVASATVRQRSGRGNAMAGKKVLLQLPERARRGEMPEERMPEYEALEGLAEVVEFRSADPDAFLRMAKDVTASS